ncbi:MAG: protein kinase, partial [Myxococcota bacterium]
MELRLDRYDVLHLLGTGGMAEVYLARHRELGTLHAVKWIKDRDPRRFGRLRTEGELQRSLRHPNVVGVSEVVASVDGDPVLVMDHVDGPSLADLLGVKIPLTIGEIDALATGILAGVAAAHARDWVHRDLKPSNVLLARVDDRLVARVADFGLARALGPDGAAEAGSTTRRGLGTQRYMPLEQLVGAPADKRMDVFALGAVLYELVHGHAAFPTVPAWEQSIRAELVPPMTRPDAPERFGRAVAAALGPRDRRPVDAAALAELWWGEPSAKPAAHAPFRPELVALAAVIGAHVPPERRSASTRTPADARHLSLCARCRRDADRPTATPAPSTLASMDPGSRGPGSPSASAGPAVVVAIADRDPPEVHPFVRSEDAIRLARAAGAGAGAHPDPHLARLLAAIARPGQVLTTSDALPSLGDPASSSFGRWRLGGSARHVELVALIARDGDPLEHPPDDGPAGWRIVPRDGGWGPARAVEHRLPPEVDRFVEREAELVALAARLQRERWVTLHGPAGVGKTRLAVRYGWGWLGAWSGGVWFCDLADAHGVEDLTLSVARALGVPLGDGSPVEQLGHALAARGRCLVILDNVEQLDPSTDAALDAWRAATVDAAFLVTSRVARGPHADGVVPLEPLADDAGVALFVERAAAVRRDFDPGHEPDAIRALVARLDGLPLAIELCAARVRTMRPGQILERLDQRFRLLAGDDGRPARHETLRAALDWSWDLLREGERSALVQLTAFDG